MLIEQAIFSSAPGDWCRGYRLTAQSHGIEESDARELAAWGPGPDSLLESGADAISINFFSLCSGSFCVSKTTPAADRPDGQGHQVSTHCLVVPAETLERYGNNPFAVLNAAFAQGLWREHDGSTERLESFYLAGRASPVDQALLAGVLADPGITWFESLVEAAVSSRLVALALGPGRPRLMASLFSCLPVECRPAFSFTTGLKNSARRPYRLFCVGDQASEHRHLLRQESVAVLQLNGNPPRRLTMASGWSGFVSCALAASRLDFLAQQLARPRIGLNVAGLNALGDLLLETLADLSGGDAAAAEKSQDWVTIAEPLPSEPTKDDSSLPARFPSHRTDFSHFGTRPTVEPAVKLAVGVETEEDPSRVLGKACPHAMDKLEQLDDLVFEAIAGKAGSLEKVKELWPIVLKELGLHMVEESRAQYLRHAMKVWRDCVDGDELRNPEMAIAAIDVVTVLIEMR